MRIAFLVPVLLCAIAPAIAQERAPEPTAPPVPVTILSKAVTASVASTDESLLNAAGNQDDWLLYGRTYDNQRFSPLTQIDRSNVKRLAIKAIIHTGIVNSWRRRPSSWMACSTPSRPAIMSRPMTRRPANMRWSYDPSPELHRRLLRAAIARRGCRLWQGLRRAVRRPSRGAGRQDRQAGVEDRPLKTLPPSPRYYSFTLAPQVYHGMVIVGTCRRGI